MSRKKYFPKSELLAYLIGNEIKSNLNKLQKFKVIIIGSQNNSKLYSEAMNIMKINNRIVDSTNITITGLRIFYNKFIKNEKK